MKNSRLPHIDVWRFIAISMVIVGHIVSNSHPWYSQTIPGIVWRLQPLGTVGVQIFFCISGFVICRGMMREVEQTGQVSMHAFYIRRFYRILPPLFLYVLVVAALTALGLFDIPFSSFIRASAFLCNFEVMGKCGWELGHTWSLAYEEHFYLVFPLLFGVLGLATCRRRLANVMAVLVAAFFLTLIADTPATHQYIGHFIFMLSGCLSALYWDRLEPVLKAQPVVVWLAAVGAIPASQFFLLPAAVQQYVLPLAMPAVICIAVLGTPTHRSLVETVFRNPALAHLGHISYGIYLWQQLATKDHGFSSPLYTLPLLAAAIVLSHISFIYFEIRMIQRGRTATVVAKVKRQVPIEIEQVEEQREAA